MKILHSVRSGDTPFFKMYLLVLNLNQRTERRPTRAQRFAPHASPSNPRLPAHAGNRTMKFYREEEVQ